MLHIEAVHPDTLGLLKRIQSLPVLVKFISALVLTTSAVPPQIYIIFG